MAGPRVPPGRNGPLLGGGRAQPEQRPRRAIHLRPSWGCGWRGAGHSQSSDRHGDLHVQSTDAVFPGNSHTHTHTPSSLLPSPEAGEQYLVPDGRWGRGRPAALPEPLPAPFCRKTLRVGEHPTGSQPLSNGQDGAQGLPRPRPRAPPPRGVCASGLCITDVEPVTPTSWRTCQGCRYQVLRPRPSRCGQPGLPHSRRPASLKVEAVEGTSKERDLDPPLPGGMCPGPGVRRAHGRHSPPRTAPSSPLARPPQVFVELTCPITASRGRT